MLELSGSARSCDDIKAGQPPADDINAQLTFVPKQGSSWSLTDTVFDGSRRRGVLGSATVTQSDPGKPVQLQLAHELLGAEDSLGTLSLNGEITAEGCGVVRPKDAPAPRPQKDLRFSIDGKTVVFQDAVLKPIPRGYDLQLSTTAVGCRLYSKGDVVANIHLDHSGQPFLMMLRGATLLGQSGARPTDDVNIAPDGDLKGETGDVSIKLDAKLAVGRYSVEADGTLVAQRCPQPGSDLETDEDADDADAAAVTEEQEAED